MNLVWNICALFTFLALSSYFFASALAFFAAGLRSQDELLFGLFASALFGVLGSAIAYFIAEATLARLEKWQDNLSNYTGHKFKFVAGLIVVVFSALIGFATGNSAVGEKRSIAEVEKVKSAELAKKADVERQKAAAKMEAESARIAAMTPAQRAAEDRVAKEKAAAAEKERAEREKENKESSARLAKFGAPPTRSSYDGTYRPVESYLKQVANDPDSIKLEICGKDVTYSKAGWVVHCEYRGRNAFNAMIRQSARFTILHDKVIYMEQEE